MFFIFHYIICAQTPCLNLSVITDFQLFKLNPQFLPSLVLTKMYFFF